MTSKTIDWSDDDLIDEDPEPECEHYESEYTAVYTVSEDITDGIDGQPVIGGHRVYYKPGTHLQHRIGGPAVIYGDHAEEWWKDGKLHRDDGPAKTTRYDRSSEIREVVYARNGVILSKEEFETKVKPSIEVEFIAAVEATKTEFEALYEKSLKLSQIYRDTHRNLQDLKSQAKEISEKYGIPVSLEIGHEKANYQPRSRMKYKDLDKNIMSERLNDAGTPSDDWYGFGMLQAINFNPTDRQGRGLEYGGWIESSNCKG